MQLHIRLRLGNGAPNGQVGWQRGTRRGGAGELEEEIRTVRKRRKIKSKVQGGIRTVRKGRKKSRMEEEEDEIKNEGWKKGRKIQ